MRDGDRVHSRPLLTWPYRYHSLKTLQSMKCFRIGRKPPGPWTNMVPPIRGGVFRKENAPPPCEIEDVSDDTSDDSEFDEKAPLRQSMRRRSPPRKEPVAVDPSLLEKGALDPAVSAEVEEPESKTAYADVAMQEEVERDIRDYPSVDSEVQLDIVDKFRALHQRVHDENFYECRLVEYGKEMARYSLLFSAFLVALYHEWYMTSAAFLGLFWVGHSHPELT